MKAGRSAQGTQRYSCQRDDCGTNTFMLDYRYKAYVPGVGMTPTVKLNTKIFSLALRAFFF